MPKRYYRVKTEDRPDLSAIGGISQQDLGGYAFPKIFPIAPVSVKAATWTVAKPGLSESKGSKGRANGEALNGTVQTTEDVVWAVSRYEGRGKLYENDGAAYADDAAADQAGAELAQRLAWNKVETESFGKVFTPARKGSATELADHAVVATLQKKAKAVRKFGRPALVMTTNAWLAFVEIPEIQDRFAKFAGAGNDIGFLMTAKPEVLKTVSTLLAFDQIILFDSDIVDAEGVYDGAIAVIGLRSEAAGNVLTTAKTRAMYGFTPVYIPEDADGEKPFDMRTWYDDDAKCNVYDAEADLEPVEAFSAAVAMTKLAASYTPVPAVAVTIAQPQPQG